MFRLFIDQRNLILDDQGLLTIQCPLDSASRLERRVMAAVSRTGAANIVGAIGICGCTGFAAAHSLFIRLTRQLLPTEGLGP